MIYATELGVKMSWDDSRVQAGMSRTESDIKGFVGNIRQSISQGIGQSLGMIGFQSIIQGVKEVAVAMISSNSEFEQFNTQFEVLLGSAEKATKFYADLNKMAIKTPFEMSELAQASQTMLAFGVDVKNIMPNLQMLGDVSLGNKQKFTSLALAFSQVQATGRLMGQDLLQMVNQGFNPLQIISEKTGLSMIELKKKMEQGAISSDMVTEAFRVATSEGGRFYQGMDKGAQTFEGLKSTFIDGAKLILREIGEPFFKEAKKGLIKAIEYISSDEGKETIKRIAEMTVKAIAFAGSLALLAKGAGILKGLFDAWGTLNGLLVTMAGKSGALIGMSQGATAAAGAAGYLRTALTALTGPVGIVIGLVTALVTAYMTNFAGFRSWVNDMITDGKKFVDEIIGFFQEFASENEDVVAFVKMLWDQGVSYLEATFKSLMDVIKGVWEIIKGVIRTALNLISGTIKAFRAALSGDWDGMWEAIKDTAQKTWAGIVTIVWNALLAIFKVIDNFGDSFSKILGVDFTLMDGAIEAAKSIIAEYEQQTKVSQGNIRKEIKKTADTQKEANKAAVKEAAFDLSGGTGGKGKAGSVAKTADQITRDLLVGIAKGVSTPKGQASCAYFASEVLKQTGANIKGTGSAKGLIDQIMKAGGFEVGAGSAKAGDLVYYRGKGYGAAKYKEGSETVGYHVGVYDGSGHAIDSSGGKTRLSRNLGKDAKFVRPQRQGQFANTEEASVKIIEDYNKALEDQSRLAATHKASMIDLWRTQLKINGTKESAIFQWEYERGIYPEMTKKQFDQRLEAMKYNETLELQNRIKEQSLSATAQMNDAVASYVSQVKKEINTTANATELQTAQWEVREGQFKSATQWQKAWVIISAMALDQDRKTKVGLEAYRQAIKETDIAMSNLGKTTKEAAMAQMMLDGMTADQASEVWTRQEKVRGATSYAEVMKELSKQMRELGLNTKEAAIQQLILDQGMSRTQAESVVSMQDAVTGGQAYKEALKEISEEMLELTMVGKNWQIQQLMIDQKMSMQQAQEVVSRREAIDALKQYRESLIKISEDSTDVIMGSLENIRGGFKGVFDNIYQGFRKMLQDMAMQYIRSQVYNLIFGWLGSIGGSRSGSGGGTFAPGKFGARAKGGHMNSRGMYLVGEDGPELVSPNGSARVFDADKTASMLTKQGSSSNQINIHFHGVTDFESFKRNKGQMIADLGSVMQKYQRKNN